MVKGEAVKASPSRLLCHHSWTSHSIGDVSVIYDLSYDSMSLSTSAFCFYISYRP